MSEKDKNRSTELPVEVVPPALREELREQLQDILNTRQVPQAVDKVVAVLSQHTYNESKLPAAHELAALESVIPGGAKTAIEMAQKEQDFFIEETKRNNKRSFTIDILGPILGVIGLLVLASLCGYMVYKGYPVAAATSAIGVIGVVVTVFVTRKPNGNGSSHNESGGKNLRRKSDCAPKDTILSTGGLPCEATQIALASNSRRSRARHANSREKRAGVRTRFAAQFAFAHCA